MSAQKALSADLMQIAIRGLLPTPRKAVLAAAVAAPPAKDSKLLG